MDKQSPGELQVWHKLAELDPANVCKQAKVTFDEITDTYKLKSFGYDLGIAVKDRKISERINEYDPSLLEKLNSGLCLSALWYLISAKDIPLSNKLIKPVSLPGGQIFEKGSHVLPLDDVAERYGSNPLGLIAQGERYGGEKSIYGDASIKLFPYPRVPVILVLWKGDEEFPDNVDILLDETCVFQMPLDIIWSTCLMSALVML